MSDHQIWRPGNKTFWKCHMSIYKKACFAIEQNILPCIGAAMLDQSTMFRQKFPVKGCYRLPPTHQNVTRTFVLSDNKSCAGSIFLFFRWISHRKYADSIYVQECILPDKSMLYMWARSHFSSFTQFIDSLVSTWLSSAEQPHSRVGDARVQSYGRVVQHFLEGSTFFSI